MKKVYIYLFAISLFLVVQWFMSGDLIATGEEGLTIYNPARTAQLYKSVWYEAGTGVPSPLFIPRWTFFSALTLLTRFLDPPMVQAFSYFVLIFLGLLGMYIFTESLSSNKLVSLASALFYLFNLYVQSQVWNRFLYTNMFAWTFLPHFLYFLRNWLIKKKPAYLLLFLLGGFVFSNTYGHPGLVITLWLTAAVLASASIFTASKKTEKLSILKRFITAFSAWFIANMWWIYPYLKTAGSSFAEISDWSSNFESLRGVSKAFPITQVIFLRQKSFFGEGSIWSDYYKSLGIWSIGLAVLLVAILGFKASRKNKHWLLIALLAIVGLFLAKGSNPPLGFSFYKVLFSMFPFTAVLRNPYEKAGLIFVLPYSIFFGYGISYLYKKIGKPLNKFAITVLLFLCCGILTLPMWTGKVYGDMVRTNVPEYYSQARKYLNDLEGDGRVLVLPTIPGDGVRYIWGYQGIEPSEYLFDKPVISKVLRAEYFDAKYMKLHEALISQGEYEGLLNQMNVSYFLLHHDQDEKVSGTSSSTQFQNILESNGNINLLSKFGEVSIYEYGPNKKGAMFEAIGNKPPELTYTKESPTSYLVEIKDATKPYVLVFKSTYNKAWEASINKQIVSEHVVIYDYANAWKINNLGDYEVHVIFKTWPWD